MKVASSEQRLTVSVKTELKTTPLIDCSKPRIFETRSEKISALLERNFNRFYGRKFKNGVITITVKIDNLFAKTIHCKWFAHHDQWMKIVSTLYIDIKKDSISLHFYTDQFVCSKTHGIYTETISDKFLPATVHLHKPHTPHLFQFNK